MIKELILSLYFCFSCMLGCAQTAEWEKVADLPLELEENSGILPYTPNKILYINDSGNKPALLATDTLGNLIQDFCIPGLSNIDWEEMTQDNKGHIYIGDFGNNNNKREDLTIYKLDAQAAVNGDDALEWGEITFTYEDQYDFPPKKKHRNFDMESMIHVGDSIYLFSKNRTKPFTGYTYCYGLPDKPGNYIAVKLDSFKTGNGAKEAYWVAGASYRSNPKSLALIGYNKVWLFYYFPDNRFFRGKHSVLYFDNFTQKEAIAFIGDRYAYYTEERNSDVDGNLYRLKLPELFDPDSFEGKVDLTKIVLEKKTKLNKILAKVITAYPSKLGWEAFNKKGQRLYYGSFIASGNKGEELFTIDTSHWKKGKYEVFISINSVREILNYKR